MARTNTGTGLAAWQADYRGHRYPSARRAIYASDDFRCIYCDCDCAEDGNMATLDHVVPHIDGGTDEPANLVTACLSCNSSRGAKTVREFADFAGLDADDLARHIRNARRRHTNIARAFAARRAA